MSDWRPVVERLADAAAHFKRREDWITRITAAIRKHLNVEGPFKAVEYPAADLHTCRLVYKPGDKPLELHVWGTVMHRTEPYESGTAVDISFYVGRTTSLIVFDSEDHPEALCCILVYADGTSERVTV